MILLIDNYDSFVYNLLRYFVRLGQQVRVVRNDDPLLRRALDEPAPASVSFGEDVLAMVLSPGPKTAREAGFCIDLVQRFSGELPILGVCLGHQIIYEAFGGQVVRASQPVHGRSSRIELKASRLFADLGESADFARYHSLVAAPQTLPECLRITAWSDDRQVMAIEHVQHPTFGIQFHPESILSVAGYRVLSNFLSLSGWSVTGHLPQSDLVDENCLWNWRSPIENIVESDENHAVALPSRLPR